VLLAMLSMKEEDEWITTSFRCPDRNRVKHYFLKAYPGCRYSVHHTAHYILHTNRTLGAGRRRGSSH
jgi:hypothetical protein